jgi:16S rRNA (guanine527-N7)-methyltransferase
LNFDPAVNTQDHHSSASAFSQALYELAPSFGVNLNDTLVRTLSDHYLAMLKWNRIAHLTSVVDPYEAAKFHYLESLYASLVINPELESIVDIGSGPGFPGIPIAAIKPNLKVFLIESQSRKASFLKTILFQLGLSNISVFHGRFQDYPNHDFDSVVCRALDKFTIILPEVLLFAKECHQILFLSGKELFNKCLNLSKDDWFLTHHSIPLSKNRCIISCSKIRST